MSRDISVTIKDITGKSWTFEKIRSLISFCKKEEKFWKGISENILNLKQISPYMKSANYFSQILADIESFKNIEDENQFSQRIQQLYRTHLNHLSGRWIWSGHSFIPTWLKSYKISVQTGNAFIEAILQKRANSVQDFNAMKGYILAYEFELQDEAELTQRRNAEKKSITQLRNQLSERTTKLIEEVDMFKGDFITWSNKSKKSFDRKIKAQKFLFCKTQKEREDVFDEYMDNSKKRITELEDTYQEKLRLEKPATYWKKQAKRYWWSGFMWIVLFLVVMGIGLLGSAYIFDHWLQGKEIGLELKSFQGVVIFITIITIYAIMVKAISKMMFSSFHLLRDAEEREQLTHVYLALTHEDGKIDETSRSIVLQALFSRADTGLLGKDSSPTMPGLHELVKMAGKGNG
jgi:hypothetical protein